MHPAFFWHMKSRKHPTKAAIFSFTCFISSFVLKYLKKARYLVMLNKHSVDILKYISGFDRTEIASIYKEFGESDTTKNSIYTLMHEKYIQGHTCNSMPCFSGVGGSITLKTTTSSPYSITSKGLAYLEKGIAEQKKSSFEKRCSIISIVLASLSIVISIATLIWK